MRLATLLLLTQAAWPQAQPLDRAYAALRAKDYDAAVAAFQEAVRLAPASVAVRKDLGYTLLKIGENEAAREEFAVALRLDPSDAHLALEYAFLCYETRQPLTARRVFDRLRQAGNPAAAQAFENIDAPLREGIARWKHAVDLDPGNFSAHHELARLHEQRDELALAAEYYEKAWRRKPDMRSLLVDVGRVLQEMKRVEEANAALLAASRGAEPRAAEAARDLLPKRYPYVYEFRRAMDLDPDNLELRRELAYLLLQLSQRAEAETEFQRIVERAPDDLLSAAQLGFLRLGRQDNDGAMPLLDRVLAGPDRELADRVRNALRSQPTLQRRQESPPPPPQAPTEAKSMGVRSLEKGYLKDALKYLTIAHETDPADFDVMLKLGWTNNILKQDRDAMKWFNLARKSPDPATSAAAAGAYRNLRPALARIRTTLWMLPLYSTRWHDLFAYTQAKSELRLGKFPLRPYLSIRFIGDTRGVLGNPAVMQPQYLSESSVILGVGVSTPVWHGLMGWFEAGESMKYRGKGITPDYRGGLAFNRNIGRRLFAETSDDGVFISRFAGDLLVYSQNRTGYTIPLREHASAQVYWNWNVTADWRGEYWANYVESGPGLRLRLGGSLTFTVHALRGAYLVRQGTFYDLRIGIWYAFTH